MYLIPVPAFADNDLWLLHDGRRALVVDPGDAGPVLCALEQHALQLESILVTHHHADHTGGVDALRKATGAKVYGPAAERIPGPFTPFGKAIRCRRRVWIFRYQTRCLRLRGDKQPTLPTSIARERLINPFLRTRQATIMAATRRLDASAHDDNTYLPPSGSGKTNSNDATLPNSCTPQVFHPFLLPPGFIGPRPRDDGAGGLRHPAGPAERSRAHDGRRRRPQATAPE
ncbi:MBL fold metallo-hydrolase [Polaromonas jejuensis]|uniref:hydroxyacylglutathione hydrolase n=1 Tax=Polaromonas jejuensis TaxID=457502 RepID=A0ABW0QCL3_9BURK